MAGISWDYVRYNGKTFSYDPCSDASDLIEGKIYGVTKTDNQESAMMYHLMDPISGEELPGFYNCTWLDQVRPKHASAFEIPVVGQPLDLLDGTTITNPLKVEDVGEDNYFVISTTSVAFIHVVMK